MKKKICFVIPSLQAGGMERVMSELLNYLADNKTYEIHLIFYGHKPTIFYKIKDSIVIHKPPFQFNNTYRLYYSIKTLFYLRKEIKRINPVSILSFGELWNNFVLLSLLRLKYPINRLPLSAHLKAIEDAGFEIKVVIPVQRINTFVNKRLKVVSIEFKDSDLTTSGALIQAIKP